MSYRNDFVFMLLTISQVLQKFIEATVPPPAPEVGTQSWVRITDLSNEAAQQHRNCLIMNLYEVEPSPFLRNNESLPSRGAYEISPLPLSLHYLFTFISNSQERALQALDGVLAAFHSEPQIETRNYRDPYGIQEMELNSELPSKIRVRLESPGTEKISHLWNGFRQGLQLALYYQVDAAIVPAYFDKKTSAVGRPQDPSVTGMPRSSHLRRKV